MNQRLNVFKPSKNSLPEGGGWAYPEKGRDEAEEPIGCGRGGALDDAVAGEPLGGDGGLLSLGAAGGPPPEGRGGAYPEEGRDDAEEPIGGGGGGALDGPGAGEPLDGDGGLLDLAAGGPPPEGGGGA